MRKPVDYAKQYAERKCLLPAKQNRKCGRKPVASPLRKGLLSAALDLWLVANGCGLTPITRNASIAYFPKRRTA